MGFAYKPPNKNEAFGNNCNVLGSIETDDITASEGWTLHKCNCCRNEDCASKEF
jgi:hypothetical protein